MIKSFNFIFLPLKFILSHELLRKLGISSLEDERHGIVIKHCKGRMIDVGCGDNQLVRKYGNGIGIDVYNSGQDVVVFKDIFPFKDKTFDTAVFTGSLNYIKDQAKSLQEAHRVLKNNGILLITMINPIVGYFRHKLAWWDNGKCKDIWNKKLIIIVEKQGFKFEKRIRFILGLNNLYIFHKDKS